ncbi:winged helix-turn-helix transcriptional regulator [Heyndrickxia vini]|uniref:Winged helix-turn-helix transcriptional regulator n=1 Tax=Heyndrickxia vini TaxID=1476025 RepID=A0ABX7E2Y4_9BACI|nr:MarR family winged helix-turn-helix transcriptional regulator [Heyndrickxia vini]QQZ09610.1 winged helix-turn-helix transcriptional regulator [Heyndrickxia vini]
MPTLRRSFQAITRSFGVLNKICCSVDGVDVSAVQSHILYEIDSNHQPSMQQVADLLAIDIATFSRQIQTLVKMELVEKVPSKEDKRASNLILTEKGEKVAREIDTQVNAFLENIFSSMTEFERQTVQGAVKLLADVMTKSPLCCGSKKESGSC